MNELTTFTNEEFGTIRTVQIDGDPYFSGKDVAVALGYKNPQEAVRNHVDEDDRTVSDLLTVNGTALTIINESGLYSLILSSKLPGAKRFKHWVTGEVLPTLRKTGRYEVQQATQQRPLTPDDYLRAAAIIATCKKCGARVLKNTPGFWDCERQRLCGNCYLKEEDRKDWRK